MNDEKQKLARMQGHLDWSLGHASELGDFEAVHRAIRAGADVNARNENDWTPIMRAVVGGNLRAIDHILRAGADVNARSDRGYTPLILVNQAPEENHAEIVDLLLQAGADVNAQDDMGVTPLMLLSGCKDQAAVDLLLKAGADPNARNRMKRTALFYAADNGRTGSTKSLLAAGADIDAQDEDGWTAVSRACLRYVTRDIRSSEAAMFLIGEGANVNLATKYGETPLMYAAKYAERGVGIIPALIEVGADLNAQDRLGRTALSWAVLNQQPRAFELLIGYGADWRMKDFEGKTVFDLAVDWGFPGGVEALRKAVSEGGLSPEGEPKKETEAASTEEMIYDAPSMG